MNKDAKIINKILANLINITLKESHPMNKCDLSLNYKYDYTYKNNLGDTYTTLTE